MYYTFTWGSAEPERYNDDGTGLAKSLLRERIVPILTDWLAAVAAESGPSGAYKDLDIYWRIHDVRRNWCWTEDDFPDLPEEFTIAFPWGITLPAVWLLEEQTLLVEVHEQEELSCTTA